jgi:transcription antitermination factor NusG
MKEKHWYVIQSKHRNESHCVDELHRKGIEALCPMTRKYIWRRKQFEPVPYFAGYIFGRFRFPDDYYTVKWTRYVSKFVKFGVDPIPLDDKFIQFIKNRMDSQGIIDDVPDFMEGDPVEFRFAPLKGLVGKILRADTAQRRVLVLMDLISYQTRIEVDSYHVAAL